jgi:hypothetical protein
MSPPHTTEDLIIKHTSSKVVGWVCVAFSIFCSAGALYAGDHRSSLFLLGFVALGGFIILSSGSMQMDSDSIRYYLPLRSYRLEWNEVQSIEIDSQGGSMVFVGENKRLAVNGPTLWTGKAKFDMSRLIAAQIDRYGIEIRPTEKAMFRFSKNTKVGA